MSTQRRHSRGISQIFANVRKRNHQIGSSNLVHTTTTEGGSKPAVACRLRRRHHQRHRQCNRQQQTSRTSTHSGQSTGQLSKRNRLKLLLKRKGSGEMTTTRGAKRCLCGLWWYTEEVHTKVACADENRSFSSLL